jgi:hypothetical protein
VHQDHQAIRPGLLELLEVTHGCISFCASSCDVPACLLVLDGDLTTSMGDLSVQLLDSLLEHSDPIGCDHTLGQNVLRLFLVRSSQETQLVLHG